MNGDAPPPSGRRPPAPRPAAGTPPPPVIPAAPPPVAHAVPAPPPPSSPFGAPPHAPQFLPPSALPRPVDLATQPLVPGVQAPRARSRLLGAALFLKGTGAVLGVCFGTIGYFAMSAADPNTILDHRPVTALKHAMLGMTLLSTVQLVGVLGTLAWKRWAVYLLVTIATLNMLVSFKADAAANALYDLLALAVFGVALSRHWGDFES